MKKAEILAPAGGPEQLTAAVRCGADAVYLGTRLFNARRNAKNFDSGNLSEAVSYCHEHGVLLFVTVNTLITDPELEMLEAEADMIAASGADAVIIQDMSVFRLFRDKYPDIKRFASTQTAVHNVDGAKFLQDIGFDRIVLARELSLSEMEKVCSSIDIQTEAFVHGAHCMSLSGACYLSAMLGGRSGNRGLCAQPCRLDFRSGSREYALSLKDMSLIDHMHDMASAGVDSFKIEGRMKRPEYVAASVTACRNSLDGKPYDLDALRAVFSRSGFTDGYLTGKRDMDMFGYRRKEDVTSADNVLKGLSSLYKNETQRIPVNMKFRMTPQSALLTVNDGMRSASAETSSPQAAINRPLDADSAYKNLSKTGGTPYYVNLFEASIEPGLMLPAAELNALRRAALNELTQKRREIKPAKAHPYERTDFKAYKPSSFSLWGRFREKAQIPENCGLEKIILPVSEIDERCIAEYGQKLIGELPAVLFPSYEDGYFQKLSSLKKAGLGEIIADNIYGIKLAQKAGLSVRGGACLNILNTDALSFYVSSGCESVTVSFELEMNKIRRLGGDIPRGIIVYGRLPLMRLRACPARSASGCGKCGGTPYLRDRMDIDFPIICDHKMYSTLHNSVPLYIADRNISGVDYGILYFTLESRDECANIIEAYRERRKTDKPHTGGLYYRELQ